MTWGFWFHSALRQMENWNQKSQITGKNYIYTFLIYLFSDLDVLSCIRTKCCFTVKSCSCLSGENTASRLLNKRAIWPWIAHLSWRQLVIVMVSWLARCRLSVAILFGWHGQTFKQEICDALAWKEDNVKHQQGKKTYKAKTLCDTPAGKEVSCLLSALANLFSQVDPF